MHRSMTRGRVATLGVLALAVGLALGTHWLIETKAYATQAGKSGEWILALAPDETLRVIGVSNPWARQARGGALTFEVYSADGTSLFESPRIDVAPGAMVYADVARAGLNDPGDPNTRRLQIRVVFRTVLPPGGHSSDLTPLAEVYSSVTGATHQRTGPIADVLYSAAGNSAD